MDAYTNLLQHLQNCNAIFTLHEHAPAHTVQDAQDGSLFPLERLIKTIAFTTGPGAYALAGVPAAARVDYRRLADELGVKRSALYLLAPEEVSAVFGVEVGAVGPIALREDVRVLLDARLDTPNSVFCGSGRPDRTLEMAFSELVRIAQARVAALTK